MTSPALQPKDSFGAAINRFGFACILGGAMEADGMARVISSTATCSWIMTPTPSGRPVSRTYWRSTRERALLSGWTKRAMECPSGSKAAGGRPTRRKSSSDQRRSPVCRSQLQLPMRAMRGAWVNAFLDLDLMIQTGAGAEPAHDLAGIIARWQSAGEVPTVDVVDPPDRGGRGKPGNRARALFLPSSRSRSIPRAFCRASLG